MKQFKTWFTGPHDHTTNGMNDLLSRPEKIKGFKMGSLAGRIFCLCLLILPFTSTPVSAQNEIVIENQKPGNPPSEWDIDYRYYEGRIMGFATDMSVNKGQTIYFKIRTDARNFKVDIYRLGYYQGNGARKVGTGTLIGNFPRIQPLNLFDTATGLVDCSNWSVSASWDVPATAVSGVYIAKITRTDNGAANQIIFVVRDDASKSDLYFKTSDATWQAYNDFGEYGTIASSLYYGRDAQGRNVTRYPNGRAVKVSYDRPFQERNPQLGRTFFFSAEYPMLRFLERNGYSISYFSDVDADRGQNLIKNHDVFLSVGHDEYWTAKERQNVEQARDAGVNLAFFSGNELYWKARWEPSRGGVGNRVLVCYKEGMAQALDNACSDKCDPLPNVWTGRWRNGCEHSQADGCKPECALTGQMTGVVGIDAIKVPGSMRGFRFWRNTSIANLAPGQEASLSYGTLGYEYDTEDSSAAYPDGRVGMSSTTINGKTHKLSLYRAQSGALVFSAGTVQWSWGLDSTHDLAGTPVDRRIQQATVNILADMNAQPGTLQSDLVPATYTTERKTPNTKIVSVKNDDAVVVGEPVIISGTATEDKGVVAGIEISFDDGKTWVKANGTTQWSYSWIPAEQKDYKVKARGFDDMGNLEKDFNGENSLRLKAYTRVPITLTIPDAYAYKYGVKPNTVYIGYNPAAMVKLKTNLDGGMAPFKYVWSNGSDKDGFDAKPVVTTNYTVTVTDFLGTTKTATVTVYAVDVNCTIDKEVEVCIGSATTCVKEDKVDEKLRQGAMLGACNESTVSSGAQTMTVSADASENTALLRELEATDGMTVKVSPNPTRNSFTIAIKSSEYTAKISLKLYSMTGKLIESQTVTPGQLIHIGQNYRPGIYLMEITDGRNKKMTKLVKE